MEISHRTIFFLAAFLALIWLIIRIMDILFLLFIAFIVMSAIRPLVEQLEKYRMPRAISIIIIYLLSFGVLGYALSSLIPALVSQTTKLISNLPRYLSLISPYAQIDINSVTSQIAPISQNIIRVTYGVFSNILALMTVLVFTFYLLLERKHLERYILSILSQDIGDQVIKAVKSVELSLGTWLRGQLILMVSVGVITYIGLLILKVDYALPLAILSGLLEIIPVIGPLLSAVPAVLVAITISPFLGLATVALYFIVQQLEGQILVPVVMNRAVGLPPLIIIVSLMIGSRLAGPTGAVLAIPIVIMIRAVILAVLARDSAGRA